MKREPRKSALLVIFLTVFIDLLGFAMVLPLLPIYARQFVTDQGGWMLGALMAVFSLMQLLFAPMWGRLSDRIGRRPVLMIGLAGSVVFYTLFGIATMQSSIVLLFVSRIGAGIAGATIATAQAYIADSTTLLNRSRGMALIGAAFGLGFTLGPLLGFLAVPTEHSQPGPWPGFVAAALSAVALTLAYFRLPESLRPDTDSAIDTPPRPMFHFRSLGQSLSIPSIALILGAIFICVYTFAKFETTLAMLIKHREGANSPFHFTWGQVCLTYAYIGFTLAVVQGGLLRRLAHRISEGILASTGALLDVAGFLMMVWAISALCISVAGIMISNFGALSVGMGFVGLRALPVVLIGGMDSVGGALVGGILVGVCEAMAGTYIETLGLEGFKEVAPYLLLLIVLLFRPYGLFGTVRIERV